MMVTSLENHINSGQSILKGSLVNVQMAGEVVPCQDTLLCMCVDVCLKPKWLSYHTTYLATSKFFILKTQEGVK
jgi:hypothetical protein